MREGGWWVGEDAELFPQLQQRVCVCVGRGGEEDERKSPSALRRLRRRRGNLAIRSRACRVVFLKPSLRQAGLFLQAQKRGVQFARLGPRLFFYLCFVIVMHDNESPNVFRILICNSQTHEHSRKFRVLQM